MPSLLACNKTDVSLAGAELQSKCFLAYFAHSIKLSNSGYLLFCQYACAILGAAKIIVAALLVHISRVIELSSNKKMVWVHTTRIVAFMKNTHVFRNWSYVKFVRKSMGDSGSIVEPEFTMVKVGFSSSPIPTMVSLIYIFHESINWVHDRCNTKSDHCLQLN